MALALCDCQPGRFRFGQPGVVTGISAPATFGEIVLLLGARYRVRFPRQLGIVAGSETLQSKRLRWCSAPATAFASALVRFAGSQVPKPSVQLARLPCCSAVAATLASWRLSLDGSQVPEPSTQFEILRLCSAAATAFASTGVNLEWSQAPRRPVCWRDCARARRLHLLPAPSIRSSHRIQIRSQNQKSLAGALPPLWPSPPTEGVWRGRTISIRSCRQRDFDRGQTIVPAQQAARS